MARLLAQRRFPSRDSVETRGLEPESGAGLVSPPVELLSLNDLPSIEFPEETGETFAENAVAKARFVSERFGLPAIADDSGLEVDALGGSPGVRSARYAGQGASDEDNYKKLLIELKGVPPLARGARFRCAMALVMPGEGEIIFEGALEGGITEGPSGGNGFGYDPVFFIPDEGRTAAELTIEEKNRISHRAKALGQLKAWLGEREEV
ncbi:MAG: RdgB/HAM1 family non-canonical purine NTP pyrophosphatase [Deltaproteobacteria bacterium]|nr:RdgB/HAM1 family non-canonical purine NTP pyrophosphatase [Deltaproteobacteria bacterium]